MKKLYIILFISGSLLDAIVSAQTTYNDVANIFYNRCTSCHHNGGIAPFSLMSFAETQPYSASILNSLNSGAMPPWPPDTTYTRFLHERIITAPEKNAILQWVADGAQEGVSALAPPAPVYGPMKYELCAEPTITVQIPTFISNATPSTNNTNPYNCFAVPTTLTQDRWLRAFEIVPGNTEIVHHVVVTVDTTGNVTSDLSGNCISQPGAFGIGGWSAGSAAVVFPGKAPLKAGIRIKAGSKLVLQIHYAPNSGGMKDSTKIRLYFYPVGETGIRPVYSETWLTNWTMRIPANDSATYTAARTVNSDVSLFSTSPHSHNICTRITNYADKAGSPLIPIIRINQWNYNWQGDYYFPKLLKIPNGYTVRARHFYNNTPSNPYHPNPNQLVTVQAGTKTSDEMLFDAFLWLKYQAGDENIDIKALLACDTLLVCKPLAAGVITGTVTVCSGQSSVTYSVSPIPNAVTYTWAYSGNGATITGNGNTVTVNFSGSATSGNLTVKGVNECGVSGVVSASKAITISGGGVAGAAGTITGSSSVCQSQTGVAYSVAAIANATDYTWSYSGGGANIVKNGNQITINFSNVATSGNLTVMGTSSCGNGAVSANYAISVNTMPSTPIITVLNNCGNSVLSTTSTGNYLWSPGGATAQSITVSASGTYSVTVSSGGSCSATSQGSVVSVKSTPSITGINGSRCGSGTVNLGASASAGTINWYTAATSGSSIATGTSYTTASLSNTATYYVDATDNGCTSTPRTAVTATISNGATATMSGSKTICAGSSSIVTIALTGTSPWAFSYGSASSSNSLNNISVSSYTFAATAGTYTVGSVSDASSCAGSGSGNATITENSAVTVSTPSVICNGNNTAYTVAFDISGGSVATYTVTGGAGTKTSNTNWKSNSINSGTAYSFTIKDAYNCSPIASVNGTPNCGCAATGLLSGSGLTICNGKAATISIALSGAAPWRFIYAIGGVNQPEVTNQMTSPYTFTTTTTGGYTMISVIDANCTGSASGNATVSQTLPTATISGGGGVCPGKTTSLSFDLTTGTPPWTFTYTNGTTTFGPINHSISKKVIQVSSPGNYTLVSISDASCNGTVNGSGNAIVTVHALPQVSSSVSPSATVCEGSNVTLTGTGTATAYAWSNGVVQNQPFTINTGKTYTVTGTDANGCSATAVRTITVNALPVITPVSDPSSAAVCSGDSIKLMGNGNLQYTWSGGRADNEFFIPSQSETFTVQGKDANNCTGTAVLGISVLPLPLVVVSVTPSVTICKGLQVTLSATGADTFVWEGTVADGVPFKPTATGSYTVTGTNNSNTCKKTAVQLITVSNCNEGVGIQQAIANLQEIHLYPNPSNGRFTISISHASFKDLEISIVNMLGTEVFTASDKNNSADYILDVNLEGLSNGMYYMKISTDNNTNIQKIIIQ